MKFFVYTRAGLIGWSELPYGDPPMGVASGPFHPTLNYVPLGILVRERHKDVRVVAEDGHELQPVAGVHFTDYSEELGNEGYEVALLGLPHEEYRRYFPALDRRS